VIPRLLLFDLDGTLTDSRPGIVRSMRHALERLAAPCPGDEALALHIGGPLRAAFASLLGAADAPLVERALALYRERYAGVGLYESRVYPGIPEALAGLAGHCRLVVATQKDARLAEAIVEHFGLVRHLGGVYGTDGGRVEDKRQVIAHLLQAERAAPAAALMIGDRAHDVQAAGASGVRTLGVLWGYGSAAELAGAGAAALCESPAALGACLARLG
jgi:phosphoglycolate phosphatase